jgi:hypothetical protein
MDTPTLLWSRWKDGGHPVQIVEDAKHTSYRILMPPAQGGIQTFPSARRLLIALTGHPGGRNWTFDRYFGLGDWAAPSPRPMMPLFEMLSPQGIVVDRGWPSPIPLDIRPAGDVAVGLGIDLALRGGEVRKLLFKGFGHWIFSAGHDPEEIYQEVCKGILIRNQGRGAFDVSRSSFGHYVHNVCRCVLSNWHRSETRRKSHEQVGSKDWREGTLTDVDASETALAGDPPGGLEVDDLQAYMAVHGARRTPEGRLALDILPLVAQGMSRAEITVVVDPSGGKLAVGKALAVIRMFAAGWMKGGGD